MGPSSGAVHEPGSKHLDLHGLAQRLEALRSTLQVHSKVVPTGMGPIDAILPGGGLGCGKVHEWIGTGQAVEEEPVRPALGLLIEMAHRAAAAGARVVWVGPAVWPYPASVVDPSRRLGLDLFVRAMRPADRLWAADLALRSGVAAAVVADGSGFDLAATRRLQLAAESGGGMCLLARPPLDAGELSAAATRWLVCRALSPSMNRRWTVELLRCKGMRPSPHAPRAWTLERDHATRALRVAPDVLDRPGEAAAGAAGVRRTG